MSFLHYSVIGALVPFLTRKAVPYVAKKLKLAAIDGNTQEKVKALSYPRHYAVLYALWNTAYIGLPFALAAGIMIGGPNLFPGKNAALFIWLGILNFIGAIALSGGLVCALFWRLSSGHFRDYVRLKLIKSACGYVVEQQIKALIKIGAVYYAILLPVTILLLK